MTCLIMDDSIGSAVWLPPFRIALNITLRSYFIPQRSWGSPYRVFPFPQGKLPLKTIFSSHYVSFQFTDLYRLGKVCIESPHSEFFPNGKSLHFQADFTPEEKQFLFWVFALLEYVPSGNEKDFVFSSPLSLVLRIIKIILKSCLSELW